MGESYFTHAFMEEHAAELAAVHARLADEQSRSIFSAVISYKITGDVSYLKNACSTPEEEYALLSDRALKTVIDGGAYNGDTAREMLAAFPGITRIIAVEPDPKTFKRLGKFAAECEKIKPVHAALWSGEGEAEFSSAGNRNSSLTNASYEHRAVAVPLISVDILSSGERVDYIKYDVEGAEREALLGSRETVLRDRPALGISLYHRSEDIFEIPLYISENYPQYDLYLRRTECLPAWEINLCAVKK
jgi:FkbM family methyltransferase